MTYALLLYLPTAHRFFALKSREVRARNRVVIDRNRITGGGVTAGIDFGLTVLAEILGEEVAKTAQLMVEYDPAPPFNAGCPENAGQKLTAAVQDMLKDDMEKTAFPALKLLLARRDAATRCAQ